METPTAIHASAFMDGEPQVREATHSTTYPIAIAFGHLTVHLTESQAVQLESQLTHVLAGIRIDAMGLG